MLILYRTQQSFAKTRYPSLLFGPIRLRICPGFGSVPEFSSQSLSVSERGLWKELRKRDSQNPRNAQKLHKSHTDTYHFCHSHPSFSPLPFSLCGQLIDKTTHIQKPKDKQLIIYATVSTKIHFAARELYTHKYKDTVCWKEWALPEYRGGGRGGLSLCDINSTNLTWNCRHRMMEDVFLVRLCKGTFGSERLLYWNGLYGSVQWKIKWYWFQRHCKQSWGLLLLQVGYLICALMCDRCSILVFPDLKGHI